MPEESSGALDLFVSYSPADERWATWIAWQLETAGYTTMLQAWDFVPGTNFIDFMDRGVRTASAVIAVLSRNYLRSRFGKLEWQATLRADPDNLSNRLVTVRVEDSPIEGLLSMITYVDLVGVRDPDDARRLLLDRIRHALAGRARPDSGPSYPIPGGDGTPDPELGGPGGLDGEETVHGGRPRRAPSLPPAYPPQVSGTGEHRSAVTVLHIEGPRFGRGLVGAGGLSSAEDLQAHIWGDVTRLKGEGASHPDLVVVSGDLTESGALREFREATEFLTGLRVLLQLEPHRLVVVPGGHDVTQLACRAYFDSCEADDIRPKPPYWPKWRHFARTFGELYAGVDDLTFDSQQPWTLFTMPDLHLVVAGLNSTMADSHRDEDHYGWLGTSQAAWFAQRLEEYEDAGWLRLGIVRHVPSTVSGPPSIEPGAAEALRDGESFDRLLGGRLNLLLHGAPPARSGPSGRYAGTTASGLAVLPPSRDGCHQLLTLHAGGLTRWPGSLAGDRHHPAPEPLSVERIDRRWQRVGAALPEAARTPPGPDGGSDRPPPAPVGKAQGGRPPEGPGEQASPATLLLDRIAEVCAARYDRSQIRYALGEPPTLWVTYPDDEVVRHLRVAAHVGPVDLATLERFLADVHAADPAVPSELVYSGPPAHQAVRDEARRRGIRLRSFIEFQGLLDLRDFVARQTHRLESDPQYPPRLHVPQRYRALAGPGGGIQTGLTDELMRLIAAEDGRFVLVLGEFGRGKTFALREVARRVPTELPNLVPILIELRSLDKAHSVDGLVAAHLAGHGEDLHLKAFRYMLREGRIVLLFDGFDELASRVTYDRAAEHLDTLLQAVEDKAKVVVSSRTQHFHTDAQVLTALGTRVGMLPHRRVLSIEGFTETQVRSFLVNRYEGDAAAADERLGFINGADLLGLCHNPRMLSFVADLDTSRLQELALAHEIVSAAQLYQEILDAWLEFETQRGEAMGGPPTSLGVDDLWQAVTTLALRLYESREAYLRLDALADAAETLVTLTDRQLSTEETVHAIGTGSLLVRTEEGLFGFIHSSVVEWLVAKDVALGLPGRVPAGEDEDVAGGRTAQAGAALLPRQNLSQLTVDFLCDLADLPALQAWCRTTLADTHATDLARRNAIRINKRLRSAAWADLRGASLVGEDLSHRELVDTDLTGADLSDAQLVRTDLTRACLQDARLARANLDEAVLAHADLRRADLDDARLFGSDLRGARIDGSRWRRAALVATTRDDGFDTAPELRGAAIAPGQPVGFELAPALVGSSYGFEIGRLPHPLAFTADGSTVAIGGDDGGVLLCDVGSGLPLRTLWGHEGRVYALGCGPDGGPLVTGAADTTIRLWDQVTGAPLHVLRGHRDWVWPVILSPSGDLLAVGDSGGSIRLWDTATGTVSHELPGHAERVWTAQFSPDGARLATGDDAGVIRVWDVASGDVRAELMAPEGPGSPVYRLRFSPDGATLATGHHGGTVLAWDVDSYTLRHRLTGHRASVYSLNFHPDGSVLATGDTHGEARLWDPLTGVARATLERQSGAIYDVRFDLQGTAVATSDSDGAIRLWDARRGHLLRELEGHKSSVWPMAFSPDGSQLATSSNDGTARLWTAATGQLRHSLRGHGRRVTAVRFNADASLLATSGSDGTVRLWDPATGQCRDRLARQDGQLVAAVFSPRMPQLATATGDGRVYLWNTGSGDYERALDAATEHVWAMTYSPDGDMLATANDDDTVQLRYASTGRLVHVLGEHRGRVRSIEFHRSEPILATGCDDRAVRIWDYEQGACLATLRHHEDRVYLVDFSLSSGLLVSAGNDGRACVWDPASGELLQVVGEPEAALWSAAFTPDGRWLVTAGDDLVVSIWDAATGELAHRLPGHSRRIRSVTASPDGRRLASASDDGTVRLWDISGDEPEPWLMLLGLKDGWAALAPDGRYKMDGDAAGAFWPVIGTRRFEPGELEPHLPEVRRLLPETPF